MGYNVFDCRSMVRNPTNNKMLSSKTNDNENLSMLSFQNKEQQTEELDKRCQCNSWPVMEETINKFRDNLTAIERKVEDVSEAIVERDMLLARLQNFDNVNQELEMLKVKVADLMHHKHNGEKKTEKTIKKLNACVERLLYENKKLKQESDWIRYRCGDKITVTRSDEAAGHLCTKGHRKITKKQVSHSFLSCRESV